MVWGIQQGIILRCGNCWSVDSHSPFVSLACVLLVIATRSTGVARRRQTNCSIWVSSGVRFEYTSMAAMGWLTKQVINRPWLFLQTKFLFLFFFCVKSFFVFSCCVLFCFVSFFRLVRFSFYYIPHEKLPVNWLASFRDGITYRQFITRPCGGVGPAGTHDGFVLMIHHMRPPMEMLRSASALNPQDDEVQGIPENETTLSFQRGSCCNLVAIELSSRGLYKPRLSFDSMVKILMGFKG